MSGIFLSYRRSDATGWAGRLHDSMVQRLPGVKIFMDVEEIPPGVKFADYILEAVGSCDVLLALIGPGWLTAAKDDGTRRLDDPDDFVRLEISAALVRGVRVVPTLVGGAVMPQRADLPGPLKELCDRQNYELPDRGWEDGCNRLASALSGIVKADKAARSKPPAGKAVFVGVASTALVLAAGAIGWALSRGKPDLPAPVKPLAASASVSAAGASPASTAVAEATPSPVSAPGSLPSFAAAPTVAGSTPSASPGGGASPKVAAVPVPRPARPNANLDEELWVAAEASQKRASYIDYLFRFPAGAHAITAGTRAGAYWVRDASTGCALLASGTPSGQLLKVVWQGACGGGKAQGKGTVLVDFSEQRRRIVSERTVVDGLDSGPCSAETRVEDKLQSRQRGTCQDYTEGNVTEGFEGTMEEFDPDGTATTTFTGTVSSRLTGEQEFRGERIFHKSGDSFNGTEKGEVGSGTLRLKSGKSIRCNFVKGRPNGSNCEVNYPDGGSYKGDLVDGRLSGHGLLKYAIGTTYEGDFRDGNATGEGVHTAADGSKMIGGFVAGKPDGDVVMVAKDGRRTAAHFVAGVRDR